LNSNHPQHVSTGTKECESRAAKKVSYCPDATHGDTVRDRYVSIAVIGVALALMALLGISRLTGHDMEIVAAAMLIVATVAMLALDRPDE